MIDSNWFFPNGLIKLTPDEEHPNENTILYTITYLLLYAEENHSLVLDWVDRDGQIKGSRSHDNMTAILVYLAKHDLGRFMDIKIFPDHKHPRDIIFIGYVQRRWWAYPLLPLLYIMFLWTAITEYKKRPTLWDWVLQGFPSRRKILKTDTEILYWIRRQLPKEYKFMHWTAKTIEPLLRKRFGQDYYQGMASIFYRYPDHPNRNYYKNVLGDEYA